MAIATGTALALSAGAGLLGAKMSADAARSAARTQAKTAGQAMAQEREMYDIAREDLAPYRETGYTALRDIGELRPLLTSQFGPEQFEQYLDPSMAFRQKLGTQATERLANVGGGALSGNTMRALEEFGQNLASTEYGNAFNRFQTERTNIYNTLANIAGMGQNAVNTGVSSGQNLAAQQTGLLTGMGAAQAAGQVGQANAYAGALGNVGNMAFLQSLMGNRTPGSAVTNYGLTSGSQMAPTTGGGMPFYGTAPAGGISGGTGLRPTAA